MCTYILPMFTQTLKGDFHKLVLYFGKGSPTLLSVKTVRFVPSKFKIYTG